MPVMSDESDWNMFSVAPLAADSRGSIDSPAGPTSNLAMVLLAGGTLASREPFDGTVCPAPWSLDVSRFASDRQPSDSTDTSKSKPRLVKEGSEFIANLLEH